jgi:DamX protein
MADNTLFSATTNNRSFDNEGLDILPLITKERMQKFELLLHLIPNLKQHIVLSGASGIGKTLLLDMLYDIDSETWQCCFVQGSAELSFEMIETKLTQTMLRNQHKSLDSAFHDFKEQHKKIVLIIDDAGLLVSGLMTTLIDYAASQPTLKLIFSLTHEARSNHHKTDKALENCYLLEFPTLNKRQCGHFLRHLAEKPRTYTTLPIDDKLLEKIYHETHGVPGRIIAAFSKLSSKNKPNPTKWIPFFVGFGVLVVAIAINQGVRYFKDERSENTPISSVEPIEKKVEKIEKMPVVQVEKVSTTTIESQVKNNDTDIIIPEFKLDIEKVTTSAPTNPAEIVSIEKKPEQAVPIVEPEKIAPVQSTPEPEPEKVVPPVEKITELVKPEVIAPVVIEPPKMGLPPIAFPKVEPAKGMQIQPLAEKKTFQVVPIQAPEVKEVKIEPIKKVEIKAIEEPVEVKKPEPVKIEPIKKVEIKAVEKPVEIKKPEPAKKVETKAIEIKKPEPAKKVETKAVEVKKPEPAKKIEPKPVKEKVETVAPAAAAHYALQLITLSNQANVEKFQKKYPDKNFRVVKSTGSEGQERFSLVYGGFVNADEAKKAKKNLSSEFAGAVPRKLN